MERGIVTASRFSIVNRPTLVDENRHFKGTGGLSRESRRYSFAPAFRDSVSGAVYLSRYANGQVAPIHLYDGLPAELVIERTIAGRVTVVRDSVTSGFVRGGRFYTRDQAARLIQRDEKYFLGQLLEIALCFVSNVHKIVTPWTSRSRA
jgi:hypothetical protein